MAGGKILGGYQSQAMRREIFPWLERKMGKLSGRVHNFHVPMRFMES